MKRLVSLSLTILTIVCLLVATERTASASYVDPGSGLLALQCITSVVAAVGYYLRRRIRAWFGPAKAKAPIVVAPNNPRNTA